ncbi:MAG: tRNA (adenosine(37)-N6)-threonylcarbamoyltransferase complex ATPase subunit type 1 TsaE [Actinomycetota bacterium]|nr:tRNA (adenosine(37)-N6)-threonylcarbamoyltransferase complex ATPase subunit type 1 TsaE [Actinomycetota bacterium]
MATPDSIVVSLPTAADTYRLGRNRLAPLLEPGDLIIASGPLGVGKTALVQGIGAGLQVDGPVLSPTFVIARVHRGGRIPLIHVDAYRLDSIREIDDLDLDSDLAQSVTAVEWGQGLVEHLTDGHLLVELSLQPGNQAGAGSEPRTATLTAGGPGWRRRLSAIMEL